jgi:putative phage-type endonuclease
MPKPLNISGSRSAAILGLSPYQTPVSVWLSIMGEEFCKSHNYESPVFEGNAATRYGQAFEDEIIRRVEIKFNKKITDQQKYFEKDYITCHVDGIMEDALIEVKTTSSRNYYNEYGEPETDRVPVNYQIQIQHCLYLSGLEKAILPVMIIPRRQDELEIEDITPDKIDIAAWVKVLNEMGYLKYYYINRNDELISLMLSHYSEFWNNHVITGTPPEPKTYDDIRALVREPIGTIIADENISRLKDEYDQIGKEISATGPLAKRREQIKIEIIKFCEKSKKVVDEDSEKYYIVRDTQGKKIASYSGKVFR